MAAKPRKKVTKRTVRPQPPAGGTPPAERTKDVKKTFGKAAPRQVMSATASGQTLQKGRRATDDQSIAARALAGIGSAVKGITSLFSKSDTPSKEKR